VLLATYNGTRWLDELLDSVFQQTDVTVSIVVGDDRSTDDTVERLLRQSSAGHAVTLLPSPSTQLGACANFLRLLREADLSGVDAVALADQDDLWRPGRLALAISRMHREGAAAYSSDVTAFWPDGRRRTLGKAHPQREFDHLFEPAGPGCTYVLTAPLARALQQELRSRPERFEGIGYHDWLIYAFARIHGFRWIIDPEPGVLYRQHGHNELGANLGIRALRHRWGRLSSGWFRGQALQIGGLWNGPHDSVMAALRRLGPRDRLWLAMRAQQLRRHPRDQIALASMIMSGVLR
jgi:rhamnosyltransferase